MDCVVFPRGSGRSLALLIVMKPDVHVFLEQVRNTRGLPTVSCGSQRGETQVDGDWVSIMSKTMRYPARIMSLLLSCPRRTTAAAVDQESVGISERMVVCGGNYGLYSFASYHHSFAAAPSPAFLE